MNNQFETKDVVSSQQGTLAEFYSRVYAILAIGIMISGVTAYVTTEFFYYQLMSALSSLPLGFILLWIVQIALVLFLSAKSFSNPTMAMGGFVAYSFLNGITLSMTLATYGIGAMGRAFIAASLTFGVMAVFGSRTKKDLSGLGRAAFILLIGIIITMVINFFMASTAVDYFVTFLTVIVFAGLTAYDNQMIKNFYYNAQQNQQSLAGIAVFCALQLYMDFINLLMAFARIFSRD